MSLLETWKDHFYSLTKPEHRAAWAIAIAADALQIFAFPLFAEGAISPADSVLDVIVGFLMIRLLGWHWAFLPTAAAKLIPGVDLFPTWTTAVWFVTRQQSTLSASDSHPDYSSHSASEEPEILPPGPAPARRH
ncbi:MAG: hypothetical protein ABSD75_01835 [Terriglobales bacterium]|jgi:hypothetical protein